MLNKVIKILVIISIFGAGIAVGASVKVLIVRDVPVFKGGGELLLLVAIPISFWLGYLCKNNKSNGGK